MAAGDLQPGEESRIIAALGDLKAVLNDADREVLQQRTHALNDATSPGRSDDEPFGPARSSGKNIEDV